MCFQLHYLTIEAFVIVDKLLRFFSPSAPWEEDKTMRKGPQEATKGLTGDEYSTAGGYFAIQDALRAKNRGVKRLLGGIYLHGSEWT